MTQQILQFITTHWALCAAFATLIVLVIVNEIISQTRGPKMLSTSAVVEHINQNNATIIDIRPQEAFAAGHIINAIHIAPDDLKKFQAYKTKPIILVCVRGVQTSTLASKLKKEGFSNTMILNGGMTAWQTAGLPTIKGKK